MANKKPNIVTSKAEENPRYVRILYLKQVKKPKQLDDQEEPLSDKKSIAYLSSLIQYQKKMDVQSITPKLKLSSPFATDFPRIDSPVHTVTRPKSFYEKRESISKINESRTKQNSLSQIIGSSNFPNTSKALRLRKKPEIVVRDSADRQMREQLQKDFIGFCIDMKQSSKKYPYKCLKPSNKAKSERDELQERSVTIIRNAGDEDNYIDERRRINKTQEIDRARLKRSIIYRKNFKEMENFTWGKLANQEFKVDL